MNKVQKAIKQIIIANVDLSAYEGTGLDNLRQVYDAEFGYNGLTPQACTNYLQGLPSVCTIPFYNGEILEIMKEAGEERATEKGQDGLIAKYWKEAGNQFYHLIK